MVTKLNNKPGRLLSRRTGYDLPEVKGKWLFVHYEQGAWLTGPRKGIQWADHEKAPGIAEKGLRACLE